MVKSNLSNVTVSPEVMASNFIVMGSIPPVVSAQDAQQAIDAHGAEYAEALFVALEALGRKITRPAATCQHCQRDIVQAEGRWIDPEAPATPEDGDDHIWRESCDESPFFAADHEPALATV